MKLKKGVTFSNISSLPESEINSQRLEDLVTEATLEEGFGKDDLHSTLQSSLNFENGHEWADLDPALQALLPRILDEEHLSDELLATLAIQFDDPGYSRNITQDNIKMPGNPPLALAMGHGVGYGYKAIERQREWVEVNKVVWNAQPYLHEPTPPSERIFRWRFGDWLYGLFNVMIKLDISSAEIPAEARRLRFYAEREEKYNVRGSSRRGDPDDQHWGWWSRLGLNGNYGTNRLPGKYPDMNGYLFHEHSTIVINKPLDDFLYMEFGEVMRPDTRAVFRSLYTDSIKLTLTHYQV
jgi:hypothetical protein